MIRDGRAQDDGERATVKAAKPRGGKMEITKKHNQTTLVPPDDFKRATKFIKI